MTSTLQWLQQRIEQARAEARKLPTGTPERRALYRQIAKMEQTAKRLAKGTVGVKEYNPLEEA